MLFGFNKYAVYAVLAAIAIAIITTYVLMWKASIRQQALLEFNNKQLEQVIKDQQTFIEKMNEIGKNQKIIIEDMNKKNEELKTKLSDLESYLNSDEATKDSDQSSEVLKRTIKQLGGR